MRSNAEKPFGLKDPGSAFTHLFGLAASLAAGVPLLLRAARAEQERALPAMTVFVVSLVLLYSASTLYHSLDLSPKGNRRLQKLDHMMISVLIAGTYTPICLLVLPAGTGRLLLTAVWGTALAEMVLNLFWITCPRWLSSALYILMGWLCLTALPSLTAALPRTGFFFLLAGGVIYTVGGVVYALKLPLFNARHPAFGSHEIFHLFVMGGSLCHYLVMYAFVL